MSREHSILVVVNDDNLRCTLTLILEKAGYLVNAVPYPTIALELPAVPSYDLVLLDLRLPECEDLTLLSLLREHQSTVPVLVLTAFTGQKTALNALKMGARVYLLKPVEPSQILQQVKQALGECPKGPPA